MAQFNIYAKVIVDKKQLVNIFNNCEKKQQRT